MNTLPHDQHIECKVSLSHGLLDEYFYTSYHLL